MILYVFLSFLIISEFVYLVDNYMITLDFYEY